MRTQALVVADDPVYLNWLQNAAPGAEFSLARPIDAQDLLERVHSTGRVDVVFFHFSRETLAERTKMVERLIESVPDIVVAAVGEAGDHDLVLAAVRAGARDFFVPQRDESNVAALLGRLLRRTAPAPGGRTQGHVYSVFAAVPYDGIAFMAEHLALAWAEHLGKSGRVLLVDIAVPAGAASLFLGLHPNYSVLDAINDSNRCDQTLVDSAFPRHSSGLHVLSLPEEVVGARPYIDSEALIQLLRVLRGLFGCIVLAMDGHLPMETIRGLLSASDRSLMVTDQSILKSRHNKHLLRAMRDDNVPLDRIGLVVDNYRASLGLQPEAIAGILELPVAATLSTQMSVRVQAMNKGESMFSVAPKDNYCIGVRQLAMSLASGTPITASARPRGLLGKLFS